MSIELPEGPFGCVVADPAYPFKVRKVVEDQRSPERHYQTMTLKEIEAMPVKQIAAKNAHLFLWIPGYLFVLGAHLPIMKAWGFKPSAIAFVWIKTKAYEDTEQYSIVQLMESQLHVGLGMTTRKNAEFCILGRRGSPSRQAKDVREVILSPIREHSRKPEEFRDRVDRYIGPQTSVVELFARSPRRGWTTWGNQTDKFKAAR